MPSGASISGAFRGIQEGLCNIVGKNSKKTPPDPVKTRNFLQNFVSRGVFWGSAEADLCDAAVEGLVSLEDFDFDAEVV